tara:strand:+ start:1045 stop:1581 length:537 start_codon:yes stop_codon:yes gene_type:complete
MMYLPPMLRTVKQRGAVVFTAGDYDLNVIAIRRGDNVDDLAVAYKVLGKWRIEWFIVSTEPTPQYLENPVNRKGAAILALGQHRLSHAAGLHRGRRALVQVGEVTVHRDNDGDKIPNSKTTPTESGYFGINVHDDRGGSAGCLLASTTTIARLRELIVMQDKAGHGDRVTLTLIQGAR